MKLYQAASTFKYSNVRRWVLYVLVDPISGVMRYVGQTQEPRRRFMSYANGHAAKSNMRLRSWFNKLNGLGLNPFVRVLGVYASSEEAGDNERDWIADLREAHGRHEILNICDGGAGVPEKGRVFSEVHRERLSEAAKRRVYSSKDCDRNRQQALRQWRDPKFLEKYVAPWSGKKQPPELVAKRVKALTGKHRTPEQKEHERVVHSTPEARERARQHAIRGWEKRRIKVISV